MIAFHGKAELKEALVANLLKHKEMDEIIQGATGEDGKGCAVWCCIDTYSHSLLSERYGIPLPICHLVDSIFEGLPVAEAKNFSLEWVRAVPVGADLSKVWNHFAAWLLTDEEQGVIRFNRHQSIIDVSELHQRAASGEIVSPEAWAAAWAAAGAAARAAAWAAARAAAWDAARAAAWGARAAARAARAAARAAAWAAAWDTARVSQAQKLIELLANAPVVVEVGK